MWPITQEWFEMYASILSSADIPFQTIVTIPRRELNFEKLTWRGWEVIRLVGTKDDARIDQSARTGCHPV